MILWVIVLLLVYNLVYWSGKFIPQHLPSWVSLVYLQFRSHWGILVLLEILAVASLFVDTIVKYDHFAGRAKTFRLLFMVVLTSALIGRIIIGLIDLYIGGGLR